jgi:cell division protein FtsZ
LYEAPAKPEMIVANPLADIVKPIEPKAEITPEPIVEVASEPVTLVNPVNEVPTIEEEIVRFELTLEEDIEDPVIENKVEEVQTPIAEIEVEAPKAEVTQEPFIKTIEPVLNEIELPELNDELIETPPASYNNNFVNEVEENVSSNLEEDFDFEMKEETSSTSLEQEERIKQSIARLKKIKELNLQINTPVGLRDLEKEPAYVRRQKKLDEVPHSSENAVSRLSLFDDGTNNGIRTNNSFLHDNVD